MPAGDDLIRVGVDARCLNGEHVRGIGKYLQEILPRIGARHPVAWDFFADRPDLPLRLPEGAAGRAHVFEQRGDRFRAWEQLALPLRAHASGVDLLHCTSMTLPWWQPLPTIVTLHDAIPWRESDSTWGPDWYRDGLMPAAFRKCAALVTVSETSKGDILGLWPSLEGKVHAIRHGVGDEYLRAEPGPVSEPLRSAGVRQPYLLYLGGLMPRKRLDWAIRVFGSLDDPGLDLVVCGLDRRDVARVMEASDPRLRPRLRLLPFVPESEMPCLYQNAVALLYPTLYEGFGFPAVEAQAVGTPALFSPVGSLNELQGPGAIVLPVDDLDAWVGACRRLIDARGTGPQPHEPARAWAGQFSWDVSADRHWEIYRQVARTRLGSDAARSGAGRVAS